jgi:hypothetical protein
MILPEGFLAVDVILNLVANIGDGLHVWPNVIRAHIMAELPFMATEVILMECTLDTTALYAIFMVFATDVDSSHTLVSPHPFYVGAGYYAYFRVL